jgi:omega-6 fatty acid desaturase (delta-12 desaturase)
MSKAGMDDSDGTRNLPRGTAASLTPSDRVGAWLVARISLTTALGLALAAAPSPAGWLAGELILAVALLQWFILLHECGHHTLFRSRLPNVAVGHLAGFFALIPFACWRRVHGLHHVWTGWQDLDPTTAALAPRKRTPLETWVTDAAWRCWLPLFSIVYRSSNYWDLHRLRTMFWASAQRRAFLLNVSLLVVAYAGLAILLGPGVILRIFVPALLLSLAMQDPLILSQHTHLPQGLAQGRKVTPRTGSQQQEHTRSLCVPQWMSRWILLGFEAHGLHHRFPAVPGYRWIGTVLEGPNAVDWWCWLRAAKDLRGSEFLFGPGERVRAHRAHP